MEAVLLRVVAPLLQYGTLGIAALAMAWVIVMQYRDNKQLTKDAVEREKAHSAKVEELLEERIIATEKAAERLAEASRLAREARSLLPPSGRY